MNPLTKLAQTMNQIKRIETPECPRCQEQVPITHHVYSDELDITVCSRCAEIARGLGPDGVGAMRVEVIQ